jgi:hypothetical protein
LLGLEGVLPDYLNERNGHMITLPVIVVTLLMMALLTVAVTSLVGWAGHLKIEGDFEY